MDIDKLETGLDALTGFDYQEAERKARSDGDNTAVLTYSTTFQTHLAAVAMGCTAMEIQRLKIVEYLKICQTVLSFLLNTSAATEDQESNTKKSA